MKEKAVEILRPRQGILRGDMWPVPAPVGSVNAMANHVTGLVWSAVGSRLADRVTFEATT